MSTATFNDIDVMEKVGLCSVLRIKHFPLHFGYYAWECSSCKKRSESFDYKEDAVIRAKEHSCAAALEYANLWRMGSCTIVCDERSIVMKGAENDRAMEFLFGWKCDNCTDNTLCRFTTQFDAVCDADCHQFAHQSAIKSANKGT